MSFDGSFLETLDLREDQFSEGESHRSQHSADFGTPPGREMLPDAVVWPETTQQVARVLSVANDRGIPVTAFGAGTALSRHVVPVQGGISLDMTRMDQILEVRPDDLQIDVEAGVYGSDIDEAVESEGLCFPPLPTSGDISTIGGMLSTDASGMQTVKYGEVRIWVLALEAVLADGTVIRAGSRASKTSSGYNLKDLLIGSEGTLGIITRATLKLGGRPRQIRGGRAIFPTVQDASDAIAEAIRYGLDVARIELLDPMSVRMACQYSGLDLPAKPMIFFEFHANHGVDEEIEFGRSLFENHRMESFEIADSGKGMSDLWQARHDLAYAVENYDERLRPHGFGDVTVPISRFPEMIREIRQLAEENEIPIPCFGHAGDGNVHYSILYDPEDPRQVDTMENLDSEIVRRAIDKGGTCTGEHGIGTEKTKYMVREHGEGSVEVMRRIKRALDPNNILNPGKIFPEQPPSDASADGGSRPRSSPGP